VLREIPFLTLLDAQSPNVAVGIEKIADTVAHVRFVGTDWASDEVVLMKMLQV
jgi:brefeldin A-resistance guanine nucleotide exchange factor 1